MNKQEFLDRLKEDLTSLSEEERQNALKYYEEYFADAQEENKIELTANFVSPEELAQKIEAELAAIENHDATVVGDGVPDVPPQNNHLGAPQNGIPVAPQNDIPPSSPPPPPPQYQKNTYYNPKKAGNSWKIILILCTAMFWMPIVVALASTAFGIFMAVIGVSFAVASMALAGFVMVGAGFMSVGYGIFNLFTAGISALYPLGLGFVVAGVGVIFAYGFTKLAVIMFKSQFGAARWALRGLKNKFVRQGA